MEMKAWLFFSLWALTSLAFLKLGFNALDRTHLSSSTPPFIMFLFKHAFAVSVSHSCDYTFAYCKHIRRPDDRYHSLMAIALSPVLVFTTLLGGPPSFCFIQAVFCFPIAGDPAFSRMLDDGICVAVDYFVKLTLLCFGGRTRFVPVPVLLIAAYTSTVWAAVSEERNEMLPDEENQSFLNHDNRKIERGTLVGFGVRIMMAAVLLWREDRNQSWWRRRILSGRRKLIEFMIGMVGTILFQNFFRLTTFDHVLAFLFLAVAWLGNLALLRAAGDFGVLNFLLGNVVVGCTVSQFGLRGTTWVAYGASVVLYGLRLKLQNLTLVDKGEHYPRVIVW